MNQVNRNLQATILIVINTIIIVNSPFWLLTSQARNLIRFHLKIENELNKLLTYETTEKIENLDC